jgi:hypothetical protein
MAERYINAWNKEVIEDIDIEFRKMINNIENKFGVTFINAGIAGGLDARSGMGDGVRASIGFKDGMRMALSKEHVGKKFSEQEKKEWNNYVKRSKNKELAMLGLGTVLTLTYMDYIELESSNKCSKLTMSILSTSDEGTTHLWSFSKYNYYKGSAKVIDQNLFIPADIKSKHPIASFRINSYHPDLKDFEFTKIKPEHLSIDVQVLGRNKDYNSNSIVIKITQRLDIDDIHLKHEIIVGLLPKEISSFITKEMILKAKMEKLGF